MVIEWVANRILKNQGISNRYLLKNKRSIYIASIIFIIIDLISNFAAISIKGKQLKNRGNLWINKLRIVAEGRRKRQNRRKKEER